MKKLIISYLAPVAFLSLASCSDVADKATDTTTTVTHKADPFAEDTTTTTTQKSLQQPVDAASSRDLRDTN